MDTILEAIVTMLSAGVPSNYRVIYGVAPQEPDAYLPIITVSPVSTGFDASGTGGLRHQLATIQITAYVLLKDYFQESDDTTVDSIKGLVQIMEARDSTNAPTASTILGIVNNDTTLQGTVGNIMDFSISYDTIPTGRYATASLTIQTQTMLPNNC